MNDTKMLRFEIYNRTVPQWNLILHHNSILFKVISNINQVMNRDQKLAIALPVIFIIYSVSVILFLPHAHASVQAIQVPSGPQCETTYTVTYKDPTKFDEIKTVGALKQSLSGVDFSADVLDGHQWWDYMHVSNPDVNSTSTITIPTVSGSVDKIVTETMQSMDGILKVDDTITTWCS